MSNKVDHLSKPCSRCEDKRINLNICLQISTFNSLNVAFITSELNFIKFLTLELKKKVHNLKCFACPIQIYCKIGIV